MSLDDLLFIEAELVAATTPLRVDLSDIEPVTIDGSDTDLRRMLRNLVDNASRHADSRIALALRHVGTDAVLIVADDGHGIDPDDRQRVFERFARLDESRSRDDGGTGLGLSIVAQIAAAHGGQVAVVDHELGGAAFEVRLSS